MLLRQPTPELTGALHQLHLIPGRCSFPGSGHARDSTSHHQDALVDLLVRLEGFQRLHPFHLGDVHTEIVLRRHLGVFVVGRKGPNHLFPHPHGLHDDTVGESVVRKPARGDSGNDDLGQPLGPDVLVDGFETRTLTGVHGLAEGNAELIRGHRA